MKVERVVTMILVRDLDRAVRFYSRTLGLTLAAEEEGWALFEEGLGIAPSRELASEAGLRLNALVPNLYVADVEAAFRELTAVGVPFLFAPTDSGDGMVAALRDPDGNVIQLVEAR